MNLIKPAAPPALLVLSVAIVGLRTSSETRSYASKAGLQTCVAQGASPLPAGAMGWGCGMDLFLQIVHQFCTDRVFAVGNRQLLRDCQPPSIFAQLVVAGAGLGILTRFPLDHENVFIPVG